MGDLSRARKKKKFRRRRAALRSALTFWRGVGGPGRETGERESGSGTEGSGSGGRDGGSSGGRLLRRGSGAGEPARWNRSLYSDLVRLGVVALCAGISLLVALDGWKNSGGVYGGVEVGGVNVGGESRTGAEQRLVSSAADLPGEITFVAGDESVTFGREELGLRLDTRRSANRAYAVGREGGFPERLGERLESSVRAAEARPEVAYEKAAIRKAFEVEAVEAGYRTTNSPNAPVSVTPSRKGVRIADSFWNGLGARIISGERTITVPLRTVTPELTTAEAERLRPTESLSSFSTNYLSYDDTPGRTANLQIASEAVNGTLVAPGEVFSFNGLAEPLDYEAAKVIIRGKADEADGGGLCQVSSTLYVAANLAGLEIVERHPHMAELPYIQPGLDATVWFGALDMRFRNTSPGYLYLEQWVDTTTGNVNAAIYGIPTGRAGTMDSERVARYKDADKNTVTEWVTYRTITQDGEVVESGPIHTDTYTSLEEE
ncbi:VanW family protein [Rubrobacter indicoceani]|uniref:VanW family protein n=1 Tax=Rubrobacter indicoceani TaxID=2051957 RepID=UPI0013C3EDD3|nr:VanW family protein [Rubrobacter indicoceani]